MANYTELDVEKAYVAFFARPADPLGLAYWLSESNTLHLGDLYNEFGLSQEYRSLYAPYLTHDVPTDTWHITPGQEGNIVDLAYMHLFGHLADPGGKTYWVLDIQNNLITFGTLLLQLEGAAKNTVGGYQDLDTITAKANAALAFTHEVPLVGNGQGYIGDAANGAARVWLSGINTPADAAAAIQTAALFDTVSSIEHVTALNSGRTQVLSSSNPVIDVGPYDTVQAKGSDYPGNTNIHGIGSGTVVLTLDSLTPAVLDGQTISAVQEIVVVNNNTLSHEVSTTNWSDIGPGTITITGTGGVVHLTDLQQSFNEWDASTSTHGDNYAVVDDAGLAWLSFDKQAVASANTIEDLSVAEVTGSILLDVPGFPLQNIETVNLHITDTIGHASTIASLNVQGIHTLNIDGGIAGQTFKIAGDLDAGLVVIDAHNAVANLDLSVASSNAAAVFGGPVLPGDWTVAQSITLGHGDDKIRFGDTLGDSNAGPANHQDSIYGGGGNDTLYANFTTGGTRAPYSRAVQNYDLTFNSSATVDFTDALGVQTIDVQQSAFGASLVYLHQGDTTAINLHGKQVGIWDVLYSGNNVLGTGADLTFTWDDSSKGASPVIDQLRFDNVHNLNFVKTGTQDDFVGSSIIGIQGGLAAAPGFSVDGVTTQILAFDVKAQGNLSVYGPHITLPVGGGTTIAYIDALAVNRMTFTTEGNGDLTVNGGEWTPGLHNIGVIATQALQNVYFNASTAGNIHVGSIAFSSLIDHVIATSVGANIDIDAIFGYDIPAYVQGSPLPVAISGSTISSITLTTAGNNGEHINIGLIAAQDIQNFNINAGRDSTIDVSHDGLAPFHGIWLTNGLGTLTASGQGTVNEVDLSFQSFSTIDFSGLTNSNAKVWYHNSTNDVNFTGTNNGDSVWAGLGNDSVTTGSGNDNIIFNDANHAHNVISTGTGIDFVHLSNGNSADLIIVGKGGTPVLATDGSTAQTDTIEGFHGLGQDTISWGVGGTGNFIEKDAVGLTYSNALAQADSGIMVGHIFAYEVNPTGNGGNGEAWLFKDTTAVPDGHPDLVIHLVGTTDHPITPTTVFGGDIVA